jgi:hypothetical protein
MECPVCFSPAEASVRESLNVGILVLLGATAGVLGCFARFFLALARRSREAAHLVQHTDSVGAGFSRPRGLPPAHAAGASASLAEAFGGGAKADATS